jgi:FkbM family methyltransferase
VGVVRQVKLADGLIVSAPNAIEAAVVYREIFLEKTYERHGITLPPGATVFDIGANIGLYSIHVYRTVSGVHLHAFELVPDTYQVLKDNLQKHAPGAVAYNIGVADRNTDVDIRFDPFSTITTSLEPSIWGKSAKRTVSPWAWGRAALRDLAQVASPPPWVSPARRGLEMPIVRYFILALLGISLAAVHLRSRLFTRRRRCKLRTLSEVLRTTQVQVVDLVKIDVEGAEESVISGISDTEWPKIRQFVIEVHDVDDRVSRLTRLLERRGFLVIQAREDWALHELLSISTLYARRA